MKLVHPYAHKYANCPPVPHPLAHDTYFSTTWILFFSTEIQQLLKLSAQLFQSRGFPTFSTQVYILFYLLTNHPNLPSSSFYKQFKPDSNQLIYSLTNSLSIRQPLKAEKCRLSFCKLSLSSQDLYHHTSHSHHLSFGGLSAKKQFEVKLWKTFFLFWFRVYCRRLQMKFSFIYIWKSPNCNLSPEGRLSPLADRLMSGRRQRDTWTRSSSPRWKS